MYRGFQTTLAQLAHFQVSTSVVIPDPFGN